MLRAVYCSTDLKTSFVYNSSSIVFPTETIQYKNIMKIIVLWKYWYISHTRHVQLLTCCDLFLSIKTVSDIMIPSDMGMEYCFSMFIYTVSSILIMNLYTSHVFTSSFSIGVRDWPKIVLWPTSWSQTTHWIWLTHSVLTIVN